MAATNPNTSATTSPPAGFVATWLPLGLAAMCTLVFTMDGSMNIIALPSIASEFHTSPAGAVWVAVVLQFMILGLALPDRLAVRGVRPAAAVCDWLGSIPRRVGGLLLLAEPARADCGTSRAGARVRALPLDAQRDRHGRLSAASARYGIGRNHRRCGHRRRDGPPAGRPTHRRIRLAFHLHRRGAPCADDDPSGRCLPAARAASAAGKLRLSWRGAGLCGVGLAGGRAEPNGGLGRYLARRRWAGGHRGRHDGVLCVAATSGGDAGA